jgi:hypothetical protein
MKVPCFSLFNPKNDFRQNPKHDDVAYKSQHHFVKRPLCLFSVRSPSEQLQIVALPLTYCGGNSAC